MKYSIIIPHYNRPHLIIKCIQSFSNLKNKEILIIDDISTKENIEILRKNLKAINAEDYVKLYLSDKKMFLNGARNKGIDLAKGKWIFFIDDDDIVTNSFINWLNKDKQKEKYDFYRFPNIERTNDKNSAYIFKWWHKKYSPHVSTYLFNRDYLVNKNIRFIEDVESPYGEDFLLMVLIFNQKVKSKYIHHFSFYYNKYDNVESIVRQKRQDPTHNLGAVKYLISSNFKDKDVYALTFLLSDFHYTYKNGLYINEDKTRQIFSDFFNQINPGFKHWIKLYLPWKFGFFSFKKYIKGKK